MLQNSQELAASFITSLNDLRNKKGGRIEVNDVAEILNNLSHTIKDHLGASDKAMYFEIKNIAAKIKETKVGDSGSGSNVKNINSKVSDQDVKQANLELEEVVVATEKATNEILEAAEKIQEIAAGLPEDQKQKIENLTTQIFQASSFQDITGQRIKKVVTTLLEIEKSVSAILSHVSGSGSSSGSTSDSAAAGDDKKLMSGPQLSKDAPNQDEIDKLFDSLG